MTSVKIYPSSFPNSEEELFLKLVLSHNDAFRALWEEWKSRVVFDNIDHATMRLLPLLYLRLQSLKIEDSLVGRIKGVYRYAWYKNQRLLESTRQVVELLEKQNIPVLLMKGVPLLLTAYKNPGARFSGDIDLLVHPADALRAMEVLHAYSCVPKGHLYPSTRNLSYESILKHFHEVSFVNDHEIEIDLHWRIFENEHKMSSELIWKNAVPLEIQSTQCLMPCTEDLLIHVIVHGAEYNTHRTLRWVVDAITLIKNQPIDWQKLLLHTIEHDCVIEMQTACSYLVKTFNVNFPESFLKNLSNRSVSNEKQIAYVNSSNEQRFHPFGNLWFLMRLYRESTPTRSKPFLDFICEQRGLKRRQDILTHTWKTYQKQFQKIFQ
ncbi:MAG: nucleotidyltransferase family protein [Candidatus Uhrbacteria bacterium]|nr:nucleotidyltransferase family protein [Candidatus Uhrbacteria bacterium]